MKYVPEDIDVLCADTGLPAQLEDEMCRTHHLYWRVQTPLLVSLDATGRNFVGLWLVPRLTPAADNAARLSAAVNASSCCCRCFYRLTASPSAKGCEPIGQWPCAYVSGCVPISHWLRAYRPLVCEPIAKWILGYRSRTSFQPATGLLPVFPA